MTMKYEIKTTGAFKKAYKNTFFPSNSKKNR